MRSPPMQAHCGWEGNRGHDEDEVAAHCGWEGNRGHDEDEVAAHNDAGALRLGR